MVLKSVILSISFASNNIIYNIVDIVGNTLFWTSLGIEKSHGLKKLTTAAIILSVGSLGKFLTRIRCKYIHIKIRGVNKYRKLVIKSLKKLPVITLSLYDEIIIIHNGCKYSKIRRI